MADGKLVFDTKLDTKGFEQGMNQIGNIAKGTLVADAAKAATKAVVGIGKAAIDVGKDFETAMSQVAATMGITTEEIANGSEEFEMLKAKAKEMGATTKYTASEAAEGLNILAMAGLSAEEACAGIGDVMALAGAGAMSLEQSAKYVTGAVKGFGDEMENAGKYADIMAKGATMANTNVSQLGEALSGVSSNTTAYNQSVESTSVALLRLAEQNVTGAEAATALSRVMADLYTPTEKAAKALDELGIATFDESGNARDLNDVVDELNNRLSGYTDEQKLAYENTIFTTFGLKAFQKMTVSTTDTVNKFKQGIADAAGSAMQQFETQTDNLEGKLAILNSALEATGIAIYEVFGDELKDAVGGATEIIDELHASIEDGELHDSFEHLAEAFGDFAEKALEFGADALPVLIDGLAFLLDNFGALASGLITYEAVTIAAKVATMDLNAAIMANPIGLIATACALAVTGVVALTKEVRNLDDETVKMGKHALDMVEKTQKLSEGAKDTADSLNAESIYVKSLVDQLKSCTDAEGRVTGNRQKAVGIVNQLNSAVQGLNLAIDEETGMLTSATGAWDEYIATQLKQAQVAAITEELKDIEKQKLENEIEMQKIANELGEEAIDVLKRKAEMEALQNKTDWTEQEAKAWEEYGEIVTKVSDDEWALIQKHEQLEQATNDLNDDTNLLTDFMSELGPTEQEVAEATQEAAEANHELSEAEQAAADAAKEEAEALEKAKEALESTVESQVASFEKINEAAAVSKTKVLENLQSNVDAMHSWAENMNSLAERGIDDGLLQHLAEMGPEGAKQVQEFVNMTGKELEQANTLWREAVSAEKFTDGLAEQYMTAGEEISTQYVNGFIGSPEWERMSPEIREKVQTAMQGAKDAVQGSEVQEAYKEGGRLAVESTSAGITENSEKVKNDTTTMMTDSSEQAKTKVKTEFPNVGKAVDEATADGIKNNIGLVESAVEEMAKAAKTKADASIKAADFNEVGKRIPEGLAAGIRSGIGEVEAAANEAAAAAAKAAKANLKVQSPSKVFEEIGQFCIAGFAKGLNGDDLNMSIGDNIQNSLADINLSMKQQEPQPIIIESHIHLDANATGVFRMVRSENKRIYEMTGQNQLVIQ